MPDSTENKQHIYIDTYYIQAYLVKRHSEEAHAKKQVKRAIETAHNNGEIFVIFPFYVIAELINNLNRKIADPASKERAFNDFLKLLGDSKIDLKPLNEHALRMASDLKEKDGNLDVTDILIASQALDDKYSTILLTNDGPIIESDFIAQINYDRFQSKERNRILKISESI